jgi:PAS domain S-box-containing protein
VKKISRQEGKGRSRARRAAETNCAHLLAAAVPSDLTECRRREQRLAGIIASAVDAIITIDERREIMLVNPAAEQMFGYSEAELLGKPVSMLIPERYRGAHDAHIRHFARTRVTNRGIGRFGQVAGRRADGREFPVDASIAQMEWSGERLFTVVLRDVTQRIEAEKALQKNYELLDRIFATTHFCIVYLDRNFNFVRVNQAYADACGHPPGFFAGKNHFDLYPDEKIETIFRDAVVTGQPFTIYANPFQFPDHPEWGVTYWDWTLHPLRNADGAVDGLLFALLDVTERTRTAQELERKAALAQLLESLARAANEAATPEAAMKICLSRLCDFGNWTLGRVATTDRPGSDSGLPGVSVWQANDLTRHQNFIRASQNVRSLQKEGRFIYVVLREKKPVWLADIAEAHGFVRQAAALADGLRAAFALPVLAQGEVVAFLEFYADAPRPIDSVLVAASEIIAAQIAHLIERSRAMRRQAQLAVIVENSNDAIVSCGLDRTILTWNAAAERLFDYAAAEVIGRDALLLVPADRRAEAALRVERLKDGIFVSTFEAVHLGKESRRVEVSGTISPIRDLGDKLTGVSLIFRDIGERKRAEREHAQLAAIVESSNDAILIRGLDGTILSWNAAAERLFGWSAQEAVGQSIELILPPERTGMLRRSIKGAARDRSLSPVETIHLRKDGARVATQVTFSPVRDKQGNVIAHSYTVRDMSELKGKEKALRKYVGRLRELSRRLREVEESERRAISRELHDRIGQDLSTLGLILGSLGAKLPRESPPAAYKQLQDVQDLLKSIVANVRDVMAELRPPELDDYGLLTALRRLATEFAKRSGIAAELSGVDLQPRLPSIVETAMFHISREALNNIAKHARAKKVEISLYAASDRVVLDIMDDGIGFDANETPPDKQHWGLTTMRERAEAVGIVFRLESAPEAGTRIVLEAERAAI